METIEKIQTRDDLNRRLQNITAWEISNFGIEGFCGTDRFRISFFAGGIVRVQVSRYPNFKENPYTVLDKPVLADFEVLETEDKFLFSTENLCVALEKHPFQLTFKTPDGNVINSDDPGLGISWLGTEVTNYKTLQEGERFLGLGEKTGHLDRRGSAYTNWNTDAFAYGVEDDPLYLSTPFYIGLHHNLCYGIFFDNTYKTTFNFGASNDRFSYYAAENGDLDYYFIFSRTVPGIIEKYTALSGRMELPPQWSLGYQQCRYSYYPEAEVLHIARTFRDKDLPADVIYLDIHYMDEYKVFSFDQERFPDPAEMCKKLQKMGFKVVVILDPGIKIQDHYLPFEEALAANHFIQYPDGELYVGEVWPGKCHFPDFTKAETRTWWADWIKYYTEIGIAGFWNDMNEPSVWGQAIPSVVQFEFEGTRTSLKEARNIYGMQMARSTNEGAIKASDKRVFNLTRAGYSGIQRYAAVWTGDNIADDEHMLAGLRLINSMGITGISNCGFDLGGFAGDASPALFARWMSIATFTPFFRGHSMINSRAAEPWAFGEEVEEISRNYLKLRYKLMPYIYSCMAESARSGIPLNRSLALNYTWDDKVYHAAFENQFLFGPNMLIAPVASTKELTKVYLPKGKWYQFFEGGIYAGGQEIYAEAGLGELPVFVKAASIICMQNSVNHCLETPKPLLHVHVFDGQEKNTFVHYEDDGESYGYLKGEFYSRKFEFDGEESLLKINPPKGTSASKYTQLKFYFYGLRQRPGLRVNGELQRIKRETVAHLEPISEFDPLPQTPKKHFKIEDVITFTVPNASEEICIKWK